jgi:hypothetical protein
MFEVLKSPKELLILKRGVALSVANCRPKLPKLIVDNRSEKPGGAVKGLAVLRFPERNLAE